MTGRQRLLKWLYPLIKHLSKAGGKARVLRNTAIKQPGTSIYDFVLELNNGRQLPLQSLKGKNCSWLIRQAIVVIPASTMSCSACMKPTAIASA